MATTVTRYVDPNADAGGDGTTNALTGSNCAYQTLLAWNTARARDITSATGDDTIEEVICSSNGGAADTGRCAIDGWTTSATNYIDIKVAASSRHTGPPYDTSKYRIEVASNTQFWNFLIKEEYVRVNGIQVLVTMVDTNNGYGIRVDHATAFGSSDIRLENIIVKGAYSGTSGIAHGIYVDDNASIKISNCVVYDISNGATTGMDGIKTGHASAAVTVYNTTVHNCYNGVTQSAGTITSYNVGVDNYQGTDFFGGSQTTCSSSSPTFVDEDGDNFRLASGDTTWQGQGTDTPSGYLDANDIDGNARTSTWDIGAHEVVAGEAEYVMAGRYLLEVRSDGTI
jgi:hypothetical protein